MSAKAKAELILRTMPFDEVDTVCLVLPFLADEKPLRGIAGFADWRLNGRISQQMQAERITGKAAETVLFPSAYRLKVQNLLLVGLGEKAQLDRKSFQATLSKVRETLRKSKIERFIWAATAEVELTEQAVWLGEFLAGEEESQPWELLLPPESLAGCEAALREHLGKRLHFRAS